MCRDCLLASIGLRIEAFSQNSGFLYLYNFFRRYIDTAVEGSELYFYNTEGNRNSVVSQASCRMVVTRLEPCAYIKITAREKC